MCNFPDRHAPSSRSAPSDLNPHWLDLGDVVVVPLVENPRLLIDVEEFFPGLDLPRSAWCFEDQWFDAQATQLIYAIQAFLVVTPDEVVLVDGCVGSGKDRARSQFDHLDESWFGEFAATGFAPQDVSTVVLSHLHVDHVGWTTRPAEGEWVPVFDRARHLVSKRELDYWSGPDGQAAMTRTGDYLRDSVHPLVAHDLLEFAHGGRKIGRYIELVDAPGHTPGNLCVRVMGRNVELLLAGDLLHHPLQLVSPETSTRYCVDPARAAATRKQILTDVVDRGVVLQTAHFAGTSASRVSRRGSRYSLDPASDVVRSGRYRRD